MKKSPKTAVGWTAVIFLTLLIVSSVADKVFGTHIIQDLLKLRTAILAIFGLAG